MSEWDMRAIIIIYGYRRLQKENITRENVPKCIEFDFEEYYTGRIYHKFSPKENGHNSTDGDI